MVIPAEYKQTDDCAFSIKVLDFANYCKPDKFMFANARCSGRYIEDLFQINVFPQGIRKGNKSYLSIMFVSTPKMLALLNNCIFTFEFSCAASIIDVDGDKRFQQSFVYVQEPQHSFNAENLMFGFEEFVNSNILLSSSSELLPDDSLTVSFEITFRLRCILADIFWLEILQKFFVKDGDKLYFDLDSVFGKFLCDHSSVFRCMSETAMIEKKTRRVYVLPEEYDTLQYILKFIVGASCRIELAQYIPLMLEMYIVAEKYDMKVVVEACRHTLKSTLNSINDWKFFDHVMENILKISEFAERFGDECLRECAEKILENREKIEAHLREKMKMGSDLLETQPTVCMFIRRVADSKQKPQLDKMRAEPSSLLLETELPEYEDKPQLDFYT